MLSRKLRIHLNLSQIIALAFLSIIALGTVLLSLPFSTRAEGSCGFLTAAFTSVSAVCVTGLSVVDIWSTYTLFGQVVLLCMIEIGGLGFMSILAILFYILGRKDNVQSLSLMAESLGSDGLKHIGRIQKRLLIGSLGFELIGAVVMTFAFLSEMDFVHAIWYGIFHSISAFCNAGFDLLGVNAPGSSVTTVNTNPAILLTMAFLTIIGGIGFVAWDDIVTSKNPRRWSVNTRLVLIVTGTLLTVGSIAFFFMEMRNPATFGNMTAGEKVLNAFFQSATTRTAGFAGVNQGDLTGSSIALTEFLMMIGGSAGSTAGGIKTVTLIILIKTVISNAVGRKNVTLLHRSLTSDQIAYAFTIAGSFVLLSFFGGFVIDLTSGTGFTASLFESISALATVGLSLGITAEVSLPAKLMLMLFMYFGRVGLLTVTLGFFKVRDNSAIKYPSAKITIG